MVVIAHRDQFKRLATVGGMRLVSDREPRASEASGLFRRHKRLNHDGAPSAVFKDQCAALAYRDTKGIIFFSAGCVKDHIPKA